MAYLSSETVWQLNMIRLDFGKFNGEREEKLKGSIPLYARREPNRENWKDFACEMAEQYPDVVKKKPKGNGTHIDILNYHFQATSGFSLVIYANDAEPEKRVSFAMYYNQVKTIDIDEQSGLIIINERIAIK